MSGLFALLFLGCLGLLAASMVAPHKFTARLPERHQERIGRKHYGLTFTGLAVLFLILTGTSSPTMQNTGLKTAAPTPTPTATAAVHQPTITHKTVTELKDAPFTSTTQNDNSLAKGTTKVATAGVNGVETLTYDVTYSDGVQTNKQLIKDEVTTPPVTQVTLMGTYVAPVPATAAPAPSCTNGTYVNAAGNTVCRPEVSSSVPAGATARCGDGTYSFSQSRRGTCSHHDGVSSWL